MKNLLNPELLKQVRKNPNKMDTADWWYISQNTLNESFIREFKDYVNWEQICLCQEMSNNFIKEMDKYINWNSFAFSNNFSFDLLMDRKDYINWNKLLEHRMFSSEELDEIVQNVELGFSEWISLFKNQRLEEEWIRKYWFDISIDFHYTNVIWENQILSEKFFQDNFKYIDKDDWSTICEYQVLSEKFLNKHGHQFDETTWKIIFDFQTLSPKFKRKWKAILDETTWKDTSDEKEKTFIF